MNIENEQLLSAVGYPAAGKLTKVDQKLWLAYARLAFGDPQILRDDTNRTLLTEGRLEYGEAALAREAPASRNTIANNRVRLAPILDGLRDLEAKRTAGRKAEAEFEREERRTSVQKDRIIEQQVSVIAAQQVTIHALTRRLAAHAKRTVTKDDPSPPLGHRRRPVPATGPRGRGANRDAR